jgi:hypothetical protein
VIDLSAAYESEEGVSFMGDQGSLLELGLGLPSLIPGLEPLSLRYQRVRFEEGSVSLHDERRGDLERQRFEMKLDDYELLWTIPSDQALAVSFVGGYHERAMPRQIYLQEYIDLNEDESYSAYYAVSDQLLWVPSQSVDLGFRVSVFPMERWGVNLALAIGGGAYQLLTPLEGEQLDQGWLATLSGGAGLQYELPLSEWLDLKLSYQAQVNLLAPMSLPDKLRRELKSEGLDTSGFSMSFGTLDVLHRLWCSLVFHFE